MKPEQRKCEHKFKHHSASGMNTCVKCGVEKAVFENESTTDLELEDARTLASLYLAGDDKFKREMWTSDIAKICKALLDATEDY